jgi:hypothetical protein
MFKVIVSLAVLLVILGGLWWAGLITQFVPSVPMPQDFFGMNPATTTPQIVTQQETESGPVNDLPTAANDASDEAIAKDSAAIDAEISSLGSDSTTAEGSLSDKPVTQEY